MWSALRVSLGFVVVTFLTANWAHGAVVTFFDGTFNDADWESDVFENIAGGTVVSSQSATGGNPSQYLNVVNSVNGTVNSAVYGLYWKPTASYTPSTEGAILNGALSVDTQMFAGFGQGEATRTLLRQDGQFYIRIGMRIDADNVGGWMTQGQTFSQDDFQLISQPSAGVLMFDPMAHPDFSATGSTIEFGFSSANSTTGATGYTINGGYDNWKITLNTVPEPSSLALMAIGGTVMLGRRRFRLQHGLRLTRWLAPLPRS